MPTGGRVSPVPNEQIQPTRALTPAEELESPKRIRDGRCDEVVGLDGFQGSEPTPTARFSSPQCKPTWGAESA